MIICEQDYDEILDKICAFLTPGDVELLFVDAQKMREINLSERGIDRTTDVLSFPLEMVMHMPLGSIVINLDAARVVADELGHSQRDEVALLFTHGLLHVLGYDHEKDDGEMREKEREIMQMFNLPDSLIIRNEG